MHSIMRVARPSDQLPALLRFYCDGLGMTLIGSFEDHDGFDGIIIGQPHAPYHLEFTSKRGHPAPPVPSPDHLLVFYLPEQPVWQAAVDRMLALGYAPVASFNPYWDVRGLTFEDPDGYRVVLQGAGWTL